MSNYRVSASVPGVRDVNAGALLDIVRNAGQTSRTELLKRSGLSKATVSVIIADLVERGFVQETGKFQQGRGRSRVVLEFNPMVRSVVGAQIGDDTCDLVLTDLHGRPYRSVSRPLDANSTERVLQVLVDAATELCRDAESPVIGMGVGAPGSVDRDGRRITVAVSHGWADVPVADILEERLHIPVVVANRAKVSALGLMGLDRPDRPRDLIYVFLGSGVVAGIVVDGQLCFGRDGNAGDIGHVTVRPDGALCGCGNTGCLHTVAAEDAMLALARSYARAANPTSLLMSVTGGKLATLTIPMLAEAANAGDSAALATISDVGTTLGIAIANLVNTLNPEAVILGGPGAQLAEHLLVPLRQEIQRRALSEAHEKLDVTASVDEQGAVGAATLWLSRSLGNATKLTRLLDDRQG